MIGAFTAPYTWEVDVPGTRAPRWITAGLAVVLALFLWPAAASAETASFDVGDQAVVAIVARGRGNDITVRSWDRPVVQVDSAEGAPAVERRVAIFGTEKLPLTTPIPPMQYMQREGDGFGGGTLPPEEFPYAAFRAGPHDVVRVNVDAGAHVVVTVPATTGLLRTAILGGQTTIEGFRGANLYAVQGSGKLLVVGSSTTAFVQLNTGRLTLEDSAFERIRLRANNAHVVFVRCRSRQIEATTVSGPIVYDGGTFDPGLARFDSQSGDIALGSIAGAQLAGRSQNGHVFTMFDGRTPVQQAADGTATAQVGGGGPLVNAISTRGNVFLYEGSLANRRDLPPEWRPVQNSYARRREGSLLQLLRPRRP
jgi:hypothetical protein